MNTLITLITIFSLVFTKGDMNMAKTSDIIVQDGSTVESENENLASKQTNLIDLFSEPILSPELFTLPTGINEFDLKYIDGYYHLFYDDKVQTKHRQATTLEVLSSASDDLTIAGKYPSVLYENGIWHLWVWINDEAITKHYTSNTDNGIYTYVDTCPSNLADWKVAKNPINKQYYASYKRTPDGFAGVARAESPNGPWTDLGYVFSESGREFWHRGEEADPKIIFNGEKAYLLFAGWDGLPSLIQRIGIVELSAVNYKAINSSKVLANPEEVWQQRNSTTRIFSPIYLDTDGQQRIFYSHNPNAAVTAGWGYLSPSE